MLWNNRAIYRVYLIKRGWGLWEVLFQKALCCRVPCSRVPSGVLWAPLGPGWAKPQGAHPHPLLIKPPPQHKKTRFSQYGSWEALDGCKILLRGVGTICLPGKQYSKNFPKSRTFRKNVYTSRFGVIFKSSQNTACLVGKSCPHPVGAFCTHLERPSCHISKNVVVWKKWGALCDNSSC